MRDLYFFLGTEAEFIKLFPVIIEARDRGLNYKLIASGQNDVANSKLLKAIDCGEVDVELSDEKDIRKSMMGLVLWWIGTYRGSIKKIRDAFPSVDFTKGDMVVHGDTISTYMGALIAKKLGMRVCHVEAGLRSHNLLSPFPEEIDRLLTSRIARLHFAPGKVAVRNLRRAKGKVINTRQNTLLDSLAYSQSVPLGNPDVQKILGMDYFVFVMHRQENLMKKSFVRAVVKEIMRASKKRKCVVLLHKITENAFAKYGVTDRLNRYPNIMLFPRLEYFDFMKLLQNAAFVLTDGGSNQEELYYMKKPCLILRTATERNEGLGMNARLFNGNPSDIAAFIKEYENGNYKGDSVRAESPSKIIIDELMKE